MTTPYEEAQAEAERRYPLFGNEVTDFSTARRAAFLAGAEYGRGLGESEAYMRGWNDALRASGGSPLLYLEELDADAPAEDAR